MQGGLGAGTLGGWFESQVHGPVLLSNKHVLQTMNRKIWHPSAGHKDKVEIGNIIQIANAGDAALGKPADPTWATSYVKHIGLITGFVQPALAMRVWMHGGHSGDGSGTISALDFLMKDGLTVFGVRPDVQAWGVLGDSGSLIFQHGTTNVVGLMYGVRAGLGEKLALAHPITLVANNLQFAPMLQDPVAPLQVQN